MTMMNVDEMCEYLLEELKEERQKMLMNKENKYSYIFMICNDMGIILEEQQKGESIKKVNSSRF